MLLAQVFKTGEGARKRAAFETAHSDVAFYTPIRCIANGVTCEPDQNPFDPKLFKAYRWRIERTLRRK